MRSFFIGQIVKVLSHIRNNALTFTLYQLAATVIVFFQVSSGLWFGLINTHLHNVGSSLLFGQVPPKNILKMGEK